VRVEIGDMRALPYSDASFDLVVSRLAIHNIRSNGDRKKVVSERAWCVLKPGGSMMIADILATAIYEEALREMGASAMDRGATLL
jgi:arsenite methyltransferase